ncbi:MAG: hypothetical protein EHM70_26020, partial [Chloroflexota bacterium]
KISTKEFQARVRYARQGAVNRYMQTYQFAQMFGSDPNTLQYFMSSLQQAAAQLDATSIGQGVLDTMIGDILIRQEAEQRGITVSDEEMEKGVQEFFAYYAEGTPTPTVVAPTVAPPTLSATQLALVSPTPTMTPTMTATPLPADVTPTPTLVVTPTATSEPEPTATPFTFDMFENNYDEAVTNLKTGLDVSEAQLRDIIKSSLLRDKLKAVITADVEMTQEQVWARHILVADEATAQDVLLRLQNGEDFAAVAAEVSTDGTKDYGGDLGWFYREKMVAEFSDVAFTMQVGELSQPVQSEHGWHIIQVLGKDTRSLSQQEYDQLVELKFSDWLEEKRSSSEVETFDIWMELVPTEPSIPVEYLPESLMQGLPTQPEIPLPNQQ